jgi:phospholipid transport system substrate-binding protein
MITMPTRREFLALAGAAAFLVATTSLVPAQAQSSGAAAFVKQFADELVAIVNGSEPYAQKKAALGPVIDRNVDVARIARFCLGRFWASASPAQQAQYTTIFHQVLLNSISGHLGEYQGVSYVMHGESPQGDNTLVGTTITRPNQPTANVQWVVEGAGASQKVVDVVAEGTSLRLTQRSDYASYLSRHNNDIGALLTALQKQLDNAG